MSNIAIITGASSGIGAAFVKEISRDSLGISGKPIDEIWIIARREERLEALKNDLGDDRIKVHALDITSSDDISRLKKELEEKTPDIAILVNSAGIGKRACVASKPESVLEDTIDINCKSLSVISRICLPYMMKKGASVKNGSRIINVGSSAAFLPQPTFAAYAASKSYVVSFSRALDMEVRPYGCAVTVVCPGPVKTEFQTLATDGKSKEFTGFRKYVVADPEKLARASLRASKNGRHLFVYKISQKFLHVISKIVPVYWILKIESLIMPVAE